MADFNHVAAGTAAMMIAAIKTAHAMIATDSLM